MTFSKRFKDYITFKMYTWHTVHGESMVEVSVRLLGVVFADFSRPSLFQSVMSIFMCRFTSLVITGLFLAKSINATSIGDFAKITESVMVGVQVSHTVSNSYTSHLLSFLIKPSVLAICYIMSSFYTYRP